jgi:hypothetical protein
VASSSPVQAVVRPERPKSPGKRAEMPQNSPQSESFLRIVKLGTQSRALTNFGPSARAGLHRRKPPSRQQLGGARWVFPKPVRARQVPFPKHKRLWFLKTLHPTAQRMGAFSLSNWLRASTLPLQPLPPCRQQWQQ